MTGRPTKLTEEIIEQITTDISVGVVWKNAVGAAGISYQTFLSWLERGEAVSDGKLRKTKSNKLFLDFFERVEKSKHQAFVKHAKTIANAAAKGDWRASESFLKRRDPENWGDKQKHEIALDVIDVTIGKDEG